MIQNPHPYYDSPKRKESQKRSMWYLVYIAMFIMLCVIAMSVRKVIQYENANMIEVWVEYEVGFQDLNKIIFYKRHDLTDSLVFRVENIEPFYGVQCIEKLEYRLP